MSSGVFALVEVGLIALVVLGLAIWQLISLKRSIRSDGEAAERKRAPEP